DDRTATPGAGMEPKKAPTAETTTLESLDSSQSAPVAPVVTKTTRSRRAVGRDDAAEKASARTVSPTRPTATRPRTRPADPGPEPSPRPTAEVRAIKHRRHPAFKSRLLMAGLSVTGTVAVVGTLAGNELRAALALRRAKASGAGTQSAWGSSGSVATGAAPAAAASGGSAGWGTAPAAAAPGT